MPADRYRMDDAHDASSEAARQSALRVAYKHHLSALPVGNLERDQHFSWLHAGFAVVSYLLLLTDVLRTGLGLDRLPYTSVEPDTFAYFGPLAYVTTHLTTANATSNASLPFWTYKYDTTSMGMRTVAQFYGLPAWPPCVMYAQSCDETQGIPLSTVFTMVNALVDRVAAQTPHRAVTLRSHHAFRDRVYHYALPWLFNALKTRTTQAVHVRHPMPRRSLCADRNIVRRPYSCAQSWSNARRLMCGVAPTRDCDMLRIWDAIHARQQHLARVYSNHTIDLVVLDAMEDLPRSSLAYQGRKDLDIVVLTRIRQCLTAPTQCETVAVDDYRYETATFVMNARDWLAIVGLLRVVGQAYAWLRLLSLVIGCAQAQLHEPRFHDATRTAKVLVTLRTVLLIPSQVVVYGASFPISCYVLAHWIDSPAAYAMVQAYFTSLAGQTHWTLRELFQHCAVSMRTVWVIGFLCHRTLSLATCTRWSPSHGVPGMAELAITLIASLTIVAQFRSVAFRVAPVLRVFAVVPSAKRAQFQANRYDATHSTVNDLVAGSPIDAQCLLCGFLGLVGISVVVRGVKRVFPSLLPLRFSLTTTTIAPYSAGTLWPRSRLVVSWHGSVMSLDTKTKTATMTTKGHAAKNKVQQWYGKLVADRRTPPAPASPPMVLRDSTVSQRLQSDMHSVARRSREMHATILLMNVAAMTDVLTWLELRVGAGKLIGLYETKATPTKTRCLLLPYGLEKLDVDIPIDWDTLTLVAVINSKDLKWADLLRCG